MEKEVFKIKTLIDNNRMSTQELLQLITTKLEEGYTEFDIEACGQHNIGGSCWAKDRSKGLLFKLKNPGQRAGAMALAGTTIYIEGSAPADVGWLNSGAEIIVNGDCGDTAAHCAAGGRIYVAGRVGTRSGALMKHDPKFELPELWVLKNTGSFSFEFMSGGIAVICGYDCDTLSSVLGCRSCVGMVGGTIYFRGPVQDVSDSADIQKLNNDDILFLSSGMENFLKNIKKEALYFELSKWENWKKIVPMPSDKKEKKMSVSDFRKNCWIENGIFGDFIKDDFVVYSLPACGNGRIRIPKWNKTNCVDCKICLNNCPQNAITEESKIYSTLDEKCIGCGICAAVCPKNCWSLISNRKEIS
ncbi:MAG: 4Fe-4S binding protein [Candidatus Gastranaerophilales bacterium]|nr:4Fe-4S binding protein [Candidatus Gastranaerophilales bacterium]